MTKEEYQEYLQSPEWAERKKYRLLVDNGVCQCCGTHGSVFNKLTIHHLDYHNIGNENESVLMNSTVTLCELCHAAIHRVMNRRTWDDSKRPERGWCDTLPFTLHIFEGKDGLSSVIYYENGKPIKLTDVSR